MESIAHRDPNIQPALASYKKFHQAPVFWSIEESCEDYRRDVNEYAMTREAIGEERGILKSERKCLLQSLEWTVAPVPEELRAQIEQMTDLDQLQRLWEMVVMRQVHTIEEFTQYLPINEGNIQSR